MHETILCSIVALTCQIWSFVDVVVSGAGVVGHCCWCCCVG